MKKSVRNSESIKEVKSGHQTDVKSTKVLDPMRRSIQSIAPTQHPWYYVKGRPDLMEKRISARRERDEQRHRQSLQNSQYFNRRSAETQVFSKWKNNQSLIRHPRPLVNGSTQPPYDVDVETTEELRERMKLKIRSNKDLEKKYLKAQQKLKEFMKLFIELNVNDLKLEKYQKVLVSHLNELKTIKIRFDDKKEFFDLKDTHLACIRFSRVKLRRKCFEIDKHLRFHKSCVQSIQCLDDCRDILTNEELSQLSEVMGRAVKILDMYIDVNHQRNNEFQLMYDEEADNRWELQEDEWRLELQMSSGMTEKLLDSLKSILKEKLTKLLADEYSSLDNREKLVTDLNTFTIKLKSDPYLAIILMDNVYDILSELND
ncbi:cilia- and flagella-associated protein 53-like [Oppia nitens]|uniref:cilia- and flagella-associated protein 53-like n=1 Tax=Oppia nitens TaxID=1686743 RepID=UPI0023DB8EA7|nr:cilia- and flagella-associated protein 53-like [Oppia nitens]